MNTSPSDPAPHWDMSVMWTLPPWQGSINGKHYNVLLFFFFFFWGGGGGVGGIRSIRKRETDIYNV